MGKHVFFLVMVLLILLAGCRSERAGRSTPAPEEYLTALEAYEQIRPAMLAWHEDAVVVHVGSLSGAEPKWRVDSEGKAPWWVFVVHSPSTLKITEISWITGEVIEGIDQIPGKEFSAPSAEEGLPLHTMIDSNEAVGIAARSGVNPNWTLLDIGTDRYDSAGDKSIPPSWRLTYAQPDDSSQRWQVIIDAVTSEILRNDFAEP